jgi:hypothetical protein
MANTYVAIATVTVGAGGAADISFSSIPATYTDLVVLLSARPSALDDLYVKFNGSTSSITNRTLRGNGTSASSSTNDSWGIPQVVLGSTFTNAQFYFPNYTSSNYKSVSSEHVSEANGTTAYMQMTAGLWSNTAAITSLTFYLSTATFAQYSTATLYGIKNS